MPATYACSNCHQLVCVDVGLDGVFFPEGGGPTATATVRCQHCGAENTYEVPRQMEHRDLSYSCRGKDLMHETPGLRRG
ncbi:MAG TPA: hypothetical protein VKD72_03965 [Gemmataceae bacterium]|nr:hypothetical protein [Gemmataceae bacterium]